ncbi:MAG: hypothetical protein KDA89_12275 [Planctomycetaceae bacterium]|nr:hypothetical protein [Planctomycetaceae bacterium]
MCHVVSIFGGSGRVRCGGTGWSCSTTALLILLLFGQECSGQEQTLLPFAGTDSISILKGAPDLVQRLTGRIEDIAGETLTLRRDGSGAVEVFRLNDITELSFAHAPDVAEGLALQQQDRFAEAVRAFDRALPSESRSWAWNEIQALAALNAVRAGNRSDAVRRIEMIAERDPRTRHLSSLPLVWDHRLPSERRLMMTIRDLRSESAVRRLCAASSLLQTEEHLQESVSVLQRLRRTSGVIRLSELAETQLWRLSIIKTEPTDPLLDVHQDRVRELPPAAQPGPQFVVACRLRLRFRYDEAALGFLRLPLVGCDDNALTEAALQEAVLCLEAAGRTADAQRYQAELHQRQTPRPSVE